MLFRLLIFICLFFSFTFGFGEDTTKENVKQETIENKSEEENSFQIFSSHEGSLKEVKFADDNSDVGDSSSLSLSEQKELERLYDMEFPKGETFEFNKQELQTKGVYALYTMEKIYFIIGGRVYGPIQEGKREIWINKWLNPGDFQKIASDKDYEIYYFGNVTYTQLKKFHIFWLTSYNNKRFIQVSTNTCYFTDVLLKMTNYKIKFYFMREGKREYIGTRQIMKNTKKYFPPVKEVFEGEFL